MGGPILGPIWEKLDFLIVFILNLEESRIDHAMLKDDVEELRLGHGAKLRIASGHSRRRRLEAGLEEIV